jgi:nickel/cobalt exporter
VTEPGQTFLEVIDGLTIARQESDPIDSIRLPRVTDDRRAEGTGQRGQQERRSMPGWWGSALVTGQHARLGRCKGVAEFELRGRVGYLARKATPRANSIALAPRGGVSSLTDGTGIRAVTDGIFYLFSGFWLGALHAATPGHGKTIAAAYIVGARGRPVDALVLGVFVTLSHTLGIVVVAVLASVGDARSVPARIEAYLAIITGLLVVGIGLWMVGSQWTVLFPRLHGHRHDASGAHAHEHGDHDQGGTAPTHDHDHEHYHRHGWGPAHSHRLEVLADTRPSWTILLGLGLAGGLLPDPGALALLLAAIASGKPVIGLLTVLVFSLGFALVLVAVGVVAARVGQLVLTWLRGRWILWLQFGTALLILAVGVGLTLNAWRAFAALN